MDSEVISPAEFRKLQLQVNILQRFLTKTFGSSFLEFCKQAQLQLTKGTTSTSTSKSLPTLNKAQVTTITNGSGVTHGKEKSENANATRPSPGLRRLPPPPLLHRPSVSIHPSSYMNIKGAVQKGNNVAAASTVRGGNATVEDTGENEEEYEDEAFDDLAEFIQPETVFSDDEHGSTKNSVVKKSAVVRTGVKRDHTMAFGYEENGGMENGNNMQLPEGTECIVLESEDDQGQRENYTYQQDEKLYGLEEGANGEEMYEDDDGYSYSLVEEGLEGVAANEDGNYQTEELQTDNITYGIVITAQDTGIQYFQCVFCPSAKVFKHKQSLKEHYLLNHSPTPPAFQCQCGRRFLKQSQLKRHEVVHTAERPYVCPICGKDFTRKDNMTVHMVRNHAEKKHPCPVCPDKIYATPAEVNRHLRMYHSQWQQQ